MALGRMTLITLDALGTILELEPPAPLLVSELAARGASISEAAAAAALAEEIAFYRAHLGEAGDSGSLARLRERCTEVLRGGLVRAGAAVALDPEPLRDALLGALRFRAYSDVPDALRALRAAGHRIVVVSNWDVSLHEALRTAGLSELVDGAIASAEVGAEKPDPRIFAAAAALAGVEHGGRVACRRHARVRRRGGAGRGLAGGARRARRAAAARAGWRAGDRVTGGAAGARGVVWRP